MKDVSVAQKFDWLLRFPLSIFCNVLMKASSSAAGVRHARSRTGISCLLQRKGTEGRGVQGGVC